MATKNPEAEAANPPKSKKILILVVLLVVLALAAGGGWMFLSSKNATHSEDEEEEAVAVVEPSGPPTYLPLENMVVNLADPGGERVAQVGVTLELAVAADLDRVKAYMPTIRSDVLMLVSQRTADELLSKEGKEKLAEDILAAASRHFRKSEAKTKDKDKKAKGSSGNPLRAVLFSSFIVQ
ncbi:MAG: flagellar basal body-associated protein FliL [bacterium]